MSNISRKALDLAKRWLKDIESTKSPTSLLASVALSEIETLEEQYPLGASTESEGISRKALELLQAWLEEKRKYLVLLTDRMADRKKWSESYKPEQAEHYKPLYSQSVQEVERLELEIADVEQAIAKLSTESEGISRKALIEQVRYLIDTNDNEMADWAYHNVLKAIDAMPSTESEGEVLNQEKYDQARKFVDSWSVWIDHKNLIYSVIDRAIRLEREVERLSSHREDAGIERALEIRQFYVDHNDFSASNAIEEVLHALGITIPAVKDGRVTE